ASAAQSLSAIPGRPFQKDGLNPAGTRADRREARGLIAAVRSLRSTWCFGALLCRSRSAICPALLTVGRPILPGLGSHMEPVPFHLIASQRTSCCQWDRRAVRLRLPGVDLARGPWTEGAGGPVGAQGVAGRGPPSATAAKSRILSYDCDFLNVGGSDRTDEQSHRDSERRRGLAARFAPL